MEDKDYIKIPFPQIEKSKDEYGFSLYQSEEEFNSFEYVMPMGVDFPIADTIHLSILIVRTLKKLSGS